MVLWTAPLLVANNDVVDSGPPLARKGRTPGGVSEIGTAGAHLARNNRWPEQNQ